MKGAKRPEELRVLGIMSGTSIDSVDFAVCRFTKNSAELISLSSEGFPKKLRQRLHAAAANACTSYETAQLHHDLGRFYAEAASGFKGKVDLVGLHGQTIFHNPAEKNRATLQIGEPAWLAEKLGVPVISNFRSGDIAAGGQGAPLATAFHKHVFARQGRHIAVQNLGGIGNVTSLDLKNAMERILSFDTGPANVLLDLTSRHFSAGNRQYDKDGMRSRSGLVDERVLKRCLAHPYFRKAPPKSTGRELFGEPFFKRVLGLQEWDEKDLLALFTELTARSIALSYERFLNSIPHEVVLCGGGAKNQFLTERIEAALPNVGVVTSAELGWPVESIEAAAFAFLAWLRWQDLPGNLPDTTGAKKMCLLGQVTQAG